jgi:large subunit ribosomal protein L25
MELDGNTIYVTVKEAQYHPVTEEIIHLDLLRVRRDVKMKFSIPLNLVGDSVGAVEGGIVSQSANLIDIECFPTDVPDSIDVDITNLELNGTIFGSDIILPADTELLSPEDTTIAVCAAPKAEAEVAVVDDEGDEGEEGVADAKDSSSDEKSSDDTVKEEKSADESSD